jgi:hypothetical protein
MKVTKAQLKKIIKEELNNVVSEAPGHPGESNPGHPLVIDANDKLWEAAAALDALTDLIEEEGIQALGSMHVGATIEDVQSKIRRISQLSEYLK